MPHRRRKGPSGIGHVRDALRAAGRARKPIAFIVAGHNGSGKSTLWNERLANRLQIPLVNADRLTLSILPAPDEHGLLPEWAARLRDSSLQWQLLSQTGVQLFVGMIMSQRMPFAFETVFSHWERRRDGSYDSKAEVVQQLRAAGYFVVLIFVGLASVGLSVARVATRRQQGGHHVPLDKLRSRFPRTQKAIRHAAPLADRTLMFDNSRGPKHAFSIARVQAGARVLYDCRHQPGSPVLKVVAGTWLSVVAPEPTAPAAGAATSAR